jgi:hypothetical protein
MSIGMAMVGIWFVAVAACLLRQAQDGNDARPASVPVMRNNGGGR